MSCESDKPFSDGEYKTFARFRSVCRQWKGLADSTRNLCPGLELDLDGDLWRAQGGEEEMDYFHEILKPWFALVASGRPYHLRVGPDSDYSHSVPFLRSTNCGTLSVLSDGFFDKILRDEEPWPLVTNVSFCKASANDGYFGIPAKDMERTFPQLESLFVIDELTVTNTEGLQIPFQHVHLRSLHLGRPNVCADHFALLIGGLLGLKELILENGEEPSDNEDPSSGLVIHPSLERVILLRCPYIKLLSRLTLPGLQLFRIHYMAYDTISSPESIQAYIADLARLMFRSEPVKLTLSLEDLNIRLYERIQIVRGILQSVRHIHTLHLRDVYEISCSLTGDPYRTGLSRDSLQEIVFGTLSYRRSWWRIASTFIPEIGPPPIRVFICVEAQEREGNMCREEVGHARQRRLDLRFISERDMEVLLHYPIRSHSYLESADSYKRVMDP